LVFPVGLVRRDTLAAAKEAPPAGKAG